jgi:nitroreductase
MSSAPIPTAPETLEFLRLRRSRPAKTLTAPVPDRPALRGLLEIAARTPDHGKLEPWRFLVLEKPALDRLAAQVPERGAALGIEAERVEKMRRQFADADLAVCVVASPKLSDKIPEVEQLLSAGAACYGLLTAALAAGWGANWLTGWAAHDRAFVERHLGLTPRESVAGFIHLGTETRQPPERPRPDLDGITTWISD